MDTVYPMYEKTLTQLGLGEKEALVYETLLRLGKAGMGRLIQELPFKRANTYNLVADLTAKGLLTETEERGKKVFIAENPGKLHDLLEARQHELKHAHQSLEAILPDLRSVYALALNKPGVRFYEGIEGIKLVLEDTLVNNPGKTIDAFSDVAGYARYLRDWNTRHYAPKRKRLGIRERVIIPDNKEALAYMEGYQASEVTDILFLDHRQYPFTTEVNIYNSKVSFVTFSEKTHIGVIIENDAIFQTLSSIFAFCWAMGKAHCVSAQPAWLREQQVNTQQSTLNKQHTTVNESEESSDETHAVK